MSQIVSFNANPGQTVSLSVQTLDGYGNRVDSDIPYLMSIYFPDKSSAAGFPQPMTRLDTGLYFYDIIIPRGTSSLGSFIASTRYFNGSIYVNDMFIINVARPFGTSSASPI